MSLLIRGAQVTDTRSPYHQKIVDVFVEQGKIAAVGKALDKKARKTISAKGMQLSPGWVDVFADYKEPGFEHKETLTTGLQAAAAGGFTQVFVAPNTAPAISNRAMVRSLLSLAKDAPAGVLPLGSVSDKLEGKALAEMLDMHAGGALAFTDGWSPVQNANLLLKALEYVKVFDGTIIQFPIETSLAAGGLMHEGPIGTRLGMPGIATIAETVALHRDIELLRHTGSRLHVTGISSAEGVQLIKKAKKEGLNISCSVTPYHLVLNDSVMETYRSVYKTMPPIRSEKDRLALVSALKDGTIDCIASHHCPQDSDAKNKEFEYAATGMNVQQFTYPILQHFLGDKIPAERLTDALGSAARRIFGLPEASIVEGALAELTLFSAQETTDTSANFSRSANNPFLNQKLKGRVIGTVRNNEFFTF